MQNQPSSSTTPTSIRRQIFDWIVSQQDDKDNLPCQADLRELFGDLSEDVDLHLQALIREGLVILDKDGGNGISLVPTYTPAPRIEMLGQMAKRLAQPGGTPCSGSIALDLRGIGVPLEPGMFAVQVLDDRMSDAGIEYGDVALLVNTTPLRGDIVAVEEGQVLVLRRYLVVSGIPHFLAENPANPELRPGWESPMHGVLWGLIRVDPCRRQPRVQAAGAASDPVGKPRPQSPLPTVAKCKKSPKAIRRRQPDNWPKPPSGIQLNEPRGGYRLTEDAATYDTWGPSFPSEQLGVADL